MSPSAPATSFVSSEDEDNPFMTLVDAASSILDKTAADPAAEVSESEESSTPQDVNETSDKDSSCPPSLDKKLSFAEQLMTVLDDGSYSDVLVWMPDGKAFTIINPKKFTMVEMPKLFNIRNMSSFVRKLTRWGFSRNFDKETQNSDIFKHKDFRREDYKLCAQIKCTGRNLTSSGMPKPTKFKIFDNILSSGKPSTTTATQPPLIQDKKAVSLNYLDEARRLVHSERQKQNLMRHSWSGPSSERANVLTAAIESLRRERDAAVANLDPTLTAQAMALRRLLDQQQQQQLAMPSWALATSNAHSYNALVGNRRTSWGGYPPLY
jgi:hypothetical protein